MALFMTGSDAIRFRFAARKALAAVGWMLRQQDRLDFHTILKACYFADKEHLNRYGRPVFGARYRAMTYGPVPLEIYEMLKAEPYWLAELERDRYPWEPTGYRVHRLTDEPQEEDHVSESDWQAIRAGFEKARGMTFNQRTAATHGPDWQRANLGEMDYADMVDDDHPGRDDVINDLRSMGRRIVL